MRISAMLKQVHSVYVLKDKSLFTLRNREIGDEESKKSMERKLKIQHGRKYGNLPTSK